MKYPNPYTPGAGFMPAYLAGRENLLEDAEKYLDAIEKRYPSSRLSTSDCAVWGRQFF